MNKNTKQPHPQPADRYCEHCGSRMRAEIRCAAKYLDGLAGFIANPSFDAETGQRLFIWAYECPRRQNRRWFQRKGKHDHYALGEPFPLNTREGSGTWHATSKTCVCGKTTKNN